MEMGSIWERRLGLGAELDSLTADSVFSPEKNTNFVFIIAYEHDSIDENQLLFEMARYNFSSFTVRNFDISFERGDGIDMLQVRSFLNYDEAYIYLHRLLNDEQMAYKLEGLKAFIISDENLHLLMRGKSFADYFDYFDETFGRIGQLNIDDNMLDEPTDMPDPEDVQETEGDTDEWEDEDIVF